MENIETKLTEKQIFDGKIIRVHLDEVMLPDGRQAYREIVDHLGGVSILPVKDGCIYFVKQFRYAVGRRMTEIPAGLIDPNETPKQAAERELQEEIGLKPKNLKYLCTIQPSPGFLNEPHTIFMADDFEAHALPQDDDEFIDVLKIPIRTVKMLYQNGFFEDAKTVCALGYFFSR